MISPQVDVSGPQQPKSVISKSSWGFHPVPYRVCKMLRELHKVVWEQWRRAHAEGRRAQKDPQNRTRGRQDLNPDMVWYDKAYGFIELQHYANRGADRYMSRSCYQHSEHGGWMRFAPEASAVVRDYRLARTPQPSMSDVVPLELSVEEIEKLHAMWVCEDFSSIAPSAATPLPESQK